NTEVYLFKQVAFIIVGIAVVYFAHLVNYTLYSSVATIVFILVIPLLFYTLFFGVTMNEGSRWIKLPLINMTMQTSDWPGWLYSFTWRACLAKNRMLSKTS